MANLIANMQCSMRVLIFLICLLCIFCEQTRPQTFNWTQQGPHSWTEGRTKHATATISDNKILLFGGVSVGVYEGDLQDTWIYDVATDSWDSKSPSNSPSARACHAMAYIGEDKVILYGGLEDNTNHFDDTWIYDLSEESWTLMSPSSFPSARCNHKLVFIGGDRVLLFGGYQGWGDYNDETWIYDLSDNTWTQKHPNTIPHERGAYAMSFIGDDQVVLFGGAIYNDNDNYPVHDNETWIYDVSDNEWTLKSPSNIPDKRIYHDMAYLEGDQSVLFGGFGPDRETGTILNDTWIYDLSSDSWTTISFSNPEPTAVMGHSLSPVSLQANRSVALFLGSRVRSWDDLSKETWILNGQDPGISLTHNPPLTINLECGASVAPEDTGGPLTAITDCILGGLEIDYSDQINSGSCTNEYTITRTWTASDICGTTETYFQTINVIDNTEPIIDCNAFSSDIALFVAYPGDVAYLPDFTNEVTTSDNCDGVINVIQDPKDGTLLEVGDHYISFSATDACGNVSNTCNQLIVVGVDSISPNMVIQDFSKYFNINDFTKEVLVNVNDNFGIDRVICTYNGIAMNESQIKTRDLNYISDNTFSMVFQQGDFDEQGLEFYILAYDLAGNYISTGENFIYNEFDDTNAPTLDNLRFGAEQAKYEIIAIPFQSKSSNLSIQDLFIDEFGQYGNTKVWRLWRYVNDQVGDVEFGKSGFQDSQFQVGRGYWLITKNDVTIDIGPSNTIEFNQGNPFPITLIPGYNQIGNPYNFDINWTYVIDYNRDIIGSDIDFINNIAKLWKGNWNDLSNKIPAKRGAFVHNNSTQSITIYIPPIKNPESSSGRTKTDEHITKRNWVSENESEWIISLYLTSENQSYNLGGLGMIHGAQLDYDRYDELTPPRFIEFLEIYTEEPNHTWGRITKDILPVQDSGIWDFVIDQNLMDRDLKLSWDGEIVQNLSKLLALYDPIEGQLYDMSVMDGLSFEMQPNIIKEFRILYGDIKFIEDNSIPKRLIVGDPFPNPFSQNVTIPIQIPTNTNTAESLIEISIYNISGIRVNKLTQNVGRGTKPLVQWDGKDLSGSEVPSGMYIIHIGKKQDGMSKMKVFKR